MKYTTPILAMCIFLAGCAPVDVDAPVKATIPVASPRGNRLGDVRMAASAPVNVASSQPVSNSGAQTGAGGNDSWTVNIGAVRVDGLALVVALIVAGMVYVEVHGHVRRARAARKGKQP